MGTGGTVQRRTTELARSIASSFRRRCPGSDPARSCPLSRGMRAEKLVSSSSATTPSSATGRSTWDTAESRRAVRDRVVHERGAGGPLLRALHRLDRHMVLQSARLVAIPWPEALSEFLRRIEGHDLRWWLYGSAALAARGFVIQPGDIDIKVSDPWLAGRLFDDVTVGPVVEMEGWVARRSGFSAMRSSNGSPSRSKTR
jgi:hypothetical protein